MIAIYFYQVFFYGGQSLHTFCSFLILANQSFDFFAINKAQECHYGSVARRRHSKLLGPCIFQQKKKKLISNPPRLGFGRWGVGQCKLCLGNLQGTFQSIVAYPETPSPTQTLFLCLHSWYGHTGFLVIFSLLSFPPSFFVFFFFFFCKNSCGFSNVEPIAISPLEQNECYWVYFSVSYEKNSKKKRCKTVVNVDEWKGFGGMDCTYIRQFCLPKAIQIEWYRYLLCTGSILTFYKWLKRALPQRDFVLNCV